MMKCPQCEEELSPNAAFCSACGFQVKLTSTLLDAPVSRTQEHLDKLKPKKSFHDDDDDEEEDLWKGGFSPKAMIGSWVIALIVTIITLAVGVMFNSSLGGYGWLALSLLLLAGWLYLCVLFAYRKLSVRYELSTQKFIHRKGILKIITDRIEVIDMDDITYEQGIIDRMLNVGTIKITSSDQTHPLIYIVGIEDVARVAGMIDKARRKERVRRGIHIEAV